MHIMYKRIFENNIPIFKDRNVFMDFIFAILLFIISIGTYYLIMILIKFIKKHIAFKKTSIE